MNLRVLLIVMLSALMLAPSRHHCRTVQCSTTLLAGRSNERTITEFWIYDSQGRLIIDSINAPDTLAATPARTEHYEYRGDSIIGTGPYSRYMVIKVNPVNGLPLSNTQKYGIEYRAFYNAAGALDKVERSEEWVDKNGAKHNGLCKMDSIIYLNGNIIAYRTDDAPRGIKATTYCTYFANKLYAHELKPTDKRLALCYTLDGGIGFLNVQVFSKNLLKSSESNSVKKSYTYKLDSENKVTQMSTKIEEWGLNKSEYRTWTNRFSYKYLCD